MKLNEKGKPQMSEIERIIEELKNIHGGDAWHGASLADALDGVNFEQAAAGRVRPHTHSIWQIVAHIIGWEDVFRRRIEGQGTSEPDEGDFPVPIEPSQRAWTETLEKLEVVHQKLLGATEKLPDSILDQTIKDKDYSHRFLLRETINHKVYHTGQITLLKKAFAD